MKNIFLLVLLFLVLTAVGQNEKKTSCTAKIYSTSQQKPTYGTSYNDLTDYLKDHLKLKLNKSRAKGIFSVSINCKGEVFNVVFHKGNIEGKEQKEVINILLQMPEWNPAEADGQIDYQFFLDFTFIDNQFTVKPFMR
jgi:hypothetical protein